MLDTGLLLSGAVVVAAMWLTARVVVLPWPPSDALDRLLLPAIAGLLAGRMVALVLDDPTSFRSLRAFLVIRGGVELWPGAIVATGALVVALRRRGDDVLVGLARLAPVVVVGYAAYEATCLVREGCYGPHAPIGLRPEGLDETMVPLGVLVALVLVGVALVLPRWRTGSPVPTVAVATFAVAGARSIAAVWLPRLGDELTRPHRESIAVAVVAAVALGVAGVVHRGAVR